MGKRYEYILLKKPEKLSSECLTAGYIVDKLTGKPKLIFDVVKDFFRLTNNSCLFINEFEADQHPGEFYGLVQMDAEIYINIIVKDKISGEVMLMHELGHYINGDHKPKAIPNNYNYSKERTKFNGVMAQELKADEFAIRECGIENFIHFIDSLILRRSKMTWDNNRGKAIKEFELRKQHAIKYAKSIPSN